MKSFQYLCWVICLLAATTSSAQPNSPAPKPMTHAFDSMLQNLLSHSVREVRISEVPSAENTVFLDARAKAEYEVSHLPNAQWVGFTHFQKKEVKKIDKNQPIVVYCSVGYRSEKIAERLKAMGFTNVANLYGGIFEWKNQGKQVVDSRGNSTEKVHTYNKKWGQWLLFGEKIH